MIKSATPNATSFSITIDSSIKNGIIFVSAHKYRDTSIFSDSVVATSTSGIIERLTYINCTKGQLSGHVIFAIKNITSGSTITVSGMNNTVGTNFGASYSVISI